MRNGDFGSELKCVLQVYFPRRVQEKGHAEMDYYRSVKQLIACMTYFPIIQISFAI